MWLLRRVDKALGFKDATIHEAARYAFDSLDQGAVSERRLAAALQPSPDPAKHPMKQASFPESW